MRYGERTARTTDWDGPAKRKPVSAACCRKRAWEVCSTATGSVQHKQRPAGSVYFKVLYTQAYTLHCSLVAVTTKKQTKNRRFIILHTTAPIYKVYYYHLSTFLRSMNAEGLILDPIKSSRLKVES